MLFSIKCLPLFYIHHLCFDLARPLFLEVVFLSNKPPTVSNTAVLMHNTDIMYACVLSDCSNNAIRQTACTATNELVYLLCILSGIVSVFKRCSYC